MPQEKLPSDSVLISIPMSVTADLGQVIRRVRTKRISTLKSRFPSLFHSSQNSKKKQIRDNADLQNSSQGGAKTTEEIAEEGDTGSAGDKGENNDSEKEDDVSSKERDGDEDIDMNATSNSRVPQREQFASVLDYLEAKYVKGVMVDDLDEKVREKKRKKKQQKENAASNPGTTADGDKQHDGQNEDLDSDNENNMSVLSASAAGSCYSDDSGNFIDDTELTSEVALQIRASSAFGGSTKIEAETAANNREKSGSSEIIGKEIDMMTVDDDHGFFVNVGDLEMEDGYAEEDFDEDEGWMLAAKGKSKKRRRTTKDNSSSTKDAQKAKKTKANTASNEKCKKAKTTLPKKAQQQAPSKNSTDDASQVTTSDKTKKKNTSNNKGKKEPEEGADKNVDKLSSTENEKSKKKSSSANAPDEKKALEKSKLDAAKKTVADLKRVHKRLHKKCVNEIKKMTEKELPRKPKSGGKVKVAITVPGNKKGGDTITFSNPHVPSQKLKVQIPENSKPGEQFKVSVPMPKTSKSSGSSQNKFTKSAIDILDEYSKAYDDWCSAEAELRTLQPKKKAGKIELFKPGVERLKKYDEMLKEFPKNLLNPIDAVWLRKMVRRNRQNANKRMRALEATTETTEPTKKEKTRKMMSLNIPTKGTSFTAVVFDATDFERIE